jgi:hypothetical protein
VGVGCTDAFKEIEKDLQHMPEKLSCIEKKCFDV